ncbi:VQ protein [Dillenia turbinata]|uniref:VQ protein n=1 Tax=Dillenia turbinata TaxID=194707 RepID=A0AAN8VEJ5_9MAGN
METSPKLQETQNPSPKSSTSSSGSSNGMVQQQQQQLQSPKPISRSEPNNPYPTTFVQADTSSFKKVVQMLTGSSETTKNLSPAKPISGDSPATTHNKSSIPPIRTLPKKQTNLQQGFKLYERRNSMKNLKLSPLLPGFVQNNSGFSPRKPEILSPSLLDFPSLVLSPVTPLIADPFNRSPSSCSSVVVVDSCAEERAIAEKGFYLHPSPVTTPRDSEPRLLPLFPVTSPRVSGSSSS